MIVKENGENVESSTKKAMNGSVERRRKRRGRRRRAKI